MSCITYDILGRLDRQTTKPTTVMPPTNTLRNTKRSIIIITIIRFVANVCALGGFTWKMLRRRSRDTAVGMQLVATATNAIVAVVLFHFSLPLVSLLFVLFVFFSSGAYRVFSRRRLSAHSPHGHRVGLVIKQQELKQQTISRG